MVTGAGSGIGQRISIGFASAGASVVLVDISEAGLDETATMVKSTVSGAKAPLARQVRRRWRRRRSSPCSTRY